MLNRGTPRQCLTDVGRHYYERCKIVLAEVETADAIAGESKNLAHGHIRISASINYGTHCLAPVLGAYRELHPQVALGLELSDSVVDLIAEGYDAVFRVGTLPDSGLRAKALASYRMLLCASPDCQHRCLCAAYATDGDIQHRVFCISIHLRQGI